MKTIVNALRKSLNEPLFTVVRLIGRQPDYYSYASRRSRNEYGKDSNTVYAINVYPKNWPTSRNKPTIEAPSCARTK